MSKESYSIERRAPRPRALELALLAALLVALLCGALALSGLTSPPLSGLCGLGLPGIVALLLTLCVALER